MPQPEPVAFTLFNIDVMWYGILITSGIVIATLICCKRAPKHDLTSDNILNFVIICVPAAVIGARLYFVIFSWDMYKDNLLDILNIRKGGLAIYGGILTAILVIAVYCKRKKTSAWLMGDIVSIGLILGQILGRWGNFFNREVFGGYTDGLFAMQLPLEAVRSSDVTEELLEHLVTVDGIQYIQVHPTFLYESLWNLVVLILMLILYKRKKFHGQVFLLYLGGYGLGRFWIEGIRTDQLLIPGTAIPVSQVIAALMVVAAAVIYLILRQKNTERIR